MSGSEHLVLILDVGETISKNKELFDKGKHLILRFLQQKFVVGRKDLVSVILVGTSGTSHNLMDDSQFYEHITAISELESPSLSTFKALQELKPEGGKADLLDALVVATDMLHNVGKVKKGTRRRIVFITDGGMEMRGTTQVETFRRVWDEMELEINVVGMDFASDVDGDGGLKGKEIQKRTNEKILRELPNCTVVSPEAAICSLDVIRAPPIRSASDKFEIEIGSKLKIPVRVFTKTAKPAVLRHEKVVCREDDKTFSDAIREHFYTVEGDPDTVLTKEDKVDAYAYGKHYVPIHEIDKICGALQTVRCLKILCFAPRENIPRQSFMSYTKRIIPHASDKDSALALSALVQVLVSQDKVAIARYVYRRGSNPKIVALFPCCKANYDGFDLVEIPFNEDIRDFTFPSLDSVKVNEKQKDAARTMVRSLRLTEPDGDGEKFIMEPRSLFNPHLQYFYEFIHSRALNPESSIESLEISSTVRENLRELNPEKEKGSRIGLVWRASASSIDDFKNECPLQRIEKDASKKRSRFWFSGKDNEAPEKKPKQEDGRSHLGQILFSRETSGNDIAKLFSERLEREESDPNKLIDEIKGCIFDRLRHAAADPREYDVAMNLIEVLKKGCEKYSEADSFNAILFKMKEEKDIHSVLWEMLKSKQVLPIPSSSLSDVETFYDEQGPEEEAQEEEEEDDLFDELE